MLSTTTNGFDPSSGGKASIRAGQVEHDRHAVHGGVSWSPTCAPVRSRKAWPTSAGKRRRVTRRKDRHLPAILEERRELVHRQRDGRPRARVERGDVPAQVDAPATPGRRQVQRGPRVTRGVGARRERRELDLPLRQRLRETGDREPDVQADQVQRCGGLVTGLRAEGNDQLGPIDADRTQLRREPRDPAVAVDDLDAGVQAQVALRDRLVPVDGGERRVVPDARFGGFLAAARRRAPAGAGSRSRAGRRQSRHRRRRRAA